MTFVRGDVDEIAILGSIAIISCYVLYHNF